MQSESFLRAQHAIRAAVDATTHIQTLSKEVWQRVFNIFEKKNGKIIVTGVGKSGYVAMKLTATFTSLGHKAVYVHPVEALHGDVGIVGEGDCILALSFSGKTRELMSFVLHAKKTFSISVVAIVGNSDSSLAKIADAVLPVQVSYEGCPLDLAPMASTTAMLAIGDALIAGLTSPEHFTKHDFVRFHPNGTLGLSLTLVEERMTQNPESVISRTMPLQQILVRMGEVGKGLLGVVSHEGVLEGSITDGDIRRFFAHTQNINNQCAEDIMSCKPKVVAVTQTLKSALELMETHKITNLFVIDTQGTPQGIIHMHDIVNLYETGY